MKIIHYVRKHTSRLRQDATEANGFEVTASAEGADACHTAEVTTVGWREWVGMPAWGVPAVKAKIDTGARSSAIHAFDLEFFVQSDDEWVRFGIHPWQRSDADPVVVEALRIDNRTITSSSGTRSERPVVETTLQLGGRTVEAEVTLTRRDEMGFRMLIGRQALEQGFVIDPAASYLGGRPRRSVRRRNRGKV